MKVYNINDYIVIYPTTKGWELIKKILSKPHASIDIDEVIKTRQTPDGGYRDQMWEIMSNLSEFFVIGTPYLETTEITLEGSINEK